MTAERERNRRLLGGDIERRVATSRHPPLDHAQVLAPLRRPETREAFLAHVAGAGLQVEIGFARAHHMRALAQALPDSPILGFEIKRSWCAAVARRAEREGLSNIRVVEGDARPYLETLLGPASVSTFHVLFPDPWWKRKHHKRRLFEDGLIARLHDLLEEGGSLVAKTDVPAYADLMEATMAAHGGWRVEGVSNDDPVLGALPRSHRESRCRQLGIPVFAFRFVKGLASLGNETDETGMSHEP
jgi:tRNA (guanine-N7-)-methyltransferase